jgi:hypothetical protein
MSMRWLSVFLLIASLAWAAPQQPGESPSSASKPQRADDTPKLQTARSDEHSITIPAGTTVPVALKHAISTKSARPGDKVYAETTFPYVLNDQMLIPAGTYVQGVISEVKRPGRVKGRAELQVHFTTLIFPSGYTVMMPGAVENVPGAEETRMKDSEGTIQQEGEKGKDVKTAAGTTASGALIGAAAGGGKGALIGAASGGVAGLAIALLSRGSDVRLEPGTTLEMVFQRPVTLDPDKLTKK